MGGYPAAMIRVLFDWPLERRAVTSFSEEVSDSTAARRAVERRIEWDVDYVKIALADTPFGVPRLTDDEIRAITDAAHAAGRQVHAHIVTAEDAVQAARSGVDTLVHGVHLGALSDEQAAEIAANGVTVVPTLVTFDRMDQLFNQHFDPTRHEAETQPQSILDALADERLEPQLMPDVFLPWVAQLQETRAERARNVVRLHDAQVPILAGSDAAGAPAMFPGALHAELRLLASAGLSTTDVLLAATSNAAHWLEPNPDFGTVEVGKAADLLLVDGDPRADLTTIEDPLVIMRAGVIVRRL
jgi:imidazolonepropionase-like amidohydrolase